MVHDQLKNSQSPNTQANILQERAWGSRPTETSDLSKMMSLKGRRIENPRKEDRKSSTLTRHQHLIWELSARVIRFNSPTSGAYLVLQEPASTSKNSHPHPSVAYLLLVINVVFHHPASIWSATLPKIWDNHPMQTSSFVTELTLFLFNKITNTL